MCLVVLILYNTWPPNMYWLCSSVRIISIFVWGWLQRMWKKLAQDFNFSFRIDDIINIDFLYRIYPKCVWIKCYHRHSIMSASFVDLYLEKDDECRVKSKYYTQLSIPSVGMCNKLYIYIFINRLWEEIHQAVCRAFYFLLLLFHVNINIVSNSVPCRRLIGFQFFYQKDLLYVREYIITEWFSEWPFH